MDSNISNYNHNSEGSQGMPAPMRPPMRPPIPSLSNLQTQPRPVMPIVNNGVRSLPAQQPFHPNLARPPLPPPSAQIRPLGPGVLNARPPPLNLPPQMRPPTNQIPALPQPQMPSVQSPPQSSVSSSQPPFQRPPLPVIRPPIPSMAARPPVPGASVQRPPPPPPSVSSQNQGPVMYPPTIRPQIPRPPTSQIPNAQIQPQVQAAMPMAQGAPIMPPVIQRPPPAFPPAYSPQTPMAPAPFPPLARPPLAPPQPITMRPPFPLPVNSGPGASSIGPTVPRPPLGMSAAAPQPQFPVPPGPSLYQPQQPFVPSTAPVMPIAYQQQQQQQQSAMPATGYPQQPQSQLQQHQNPASMPSYQQPMQQQFYSSAPSTESAPISVSSSSHDLQSLRSSGKFLSEPNISEKYFSCTMGKIPRNASLIGKSRVPLGLTIDFYPFGDVQADRVPEINGAIVRCRRCRTYLNPCVELVDQGSRWRCNLCFLANEFPPGYDLTSKESRPELSSFVYDFSNAPVEYTVRPPQPPVFLFVLEVTQAAVQGGLLATSCRVIQEQLDAIPNEDGRSRVGFLTFDQNLHFYHFGGEQMKLLVVADPEEAFLPALNDLLVNISECRKQIDELLDQLPSFYASPSRSAPVLGPALRSAHQLLKPIGGKVIVVAASLPTRYEGALKLRDDPSILGTPKESAALQPAGQFFKLFASEAIKDQICVDLFLVPPPRTYIDVASLSGLAKYTGGKVHYYPGTFMEASEGLVDSKFIADLTRFIGQEHGYEAVLRIRASQGITLAPYHGSFFIRNSDLLSLPNMNPDHSFSAQASIDANLVGSSVYFQAALLHTTCRGERRIRVVNFVAPITDDLREVITNLDVVGIAGILPKMAVEKILSNRLEDARLAVLNKTIDVSVAFKTAWGMKSVAPGGTALLLPEKLKNFPILMHALIKSYILRPGTSTSLDLRAYYLALVKTLSAIELVNFLLPRFFALHRMDSDCGADGKLPPLLNLSSERLERHGVFLLHSGLQCFLWVGSSAHPELLQLLFGPGNIPVGRVSQLLPELDNDWNTRVRAITNQLRSDAKNAAPEYFIVREDSEPALKQFFMANLIEDRSVDGSLPSYPQWIQEIAAKVNATSA